MMVSAFLKMCRKIELIPSCCNIESLQQLIKQTITPMTNEEYEYLIEKRMLLKLYHEDVNPQSSHCEPQPGEPGLLFHEFIFLLGLIALNMQTLNPDPAKQIEEFFVDKLKFTRNEKDDKEREKDFRTFD